MSKKKVGIIGVTKIGATIAYLLATKNLYSNILLKDSKKNIAKAVAVDVSQAAKASKSKTIITAIDNYNQLKECDLIVINQSVIKKSSMNEDDLIQLNSRIMNQIVKDVIIDNPNTIIIIVSNLVDSMVYSALQTSNLSRTKILGMSGILDNSRMSHFIQEKLDFIAEDISPTIIGGNDYGMVPITNLCTINGKTIEELFSSNEINEIIKNTKKVV